MKKSTVVRYFLLLIISIHFPLAKSFKDEDMQELKTHIRSEEVYHSQQFRKKVINAESGEEMLYLSILARITQNLNDTSINKDALSLATTYCFYLRKLANKEEAIESWLPYYINFAKFSECFAITDPNAKILWNVVVFLDSHKNDTTFSNNPAFNHYIILNLILSVATIGSGQNADEEDNEEAENIEVPEDFTEADPYNFLIAQSGQNVSFSQPANIPAEDVDRLAPSAQEALRSSTEINQNLTDLTN